MEKEILKIADDANNGLSNPLGAYVELKRLEKAVKMCLESVKPYAVAEANKYHENSFTEFGATIEKRNAPGTWNFKLERLARRVEPTGNVLEEEASLAKRGTGELLEETAEAS